MKKFFILLLVTVGVFALPSCGSDEPDPDNGSKIDPTKPVADPDGTITLSMRDYNNGCTFILDRLIIKDENFRGADIASVGSVNGLGNVSTIPTTGWTNEVAVVPGNGYVAYLDNRDMFVRIYVIDYISSTGGGIMGADVKYQYPFKGVDETLKPEKTSVTLPADNSADGILMTNASFIPFRVSTDAAWLEASRISAYNTHVLYNGVIIEAAENTQPVSREATVTLTTFYDKAVKIKVTQSGVEPYVNLSVSELESNNVAKTITAASLSTNIEIDNLEVTSSGSWCTAEIATQYYAPKTIRFIDGKRVNKTIKSSPTHYLNLTMTENANYDDRTATVTVKDKTSSAKATLKLTQKGNRPYVNVEMSTMEFPVTADTKYNTLETNVEASRIDVSCDKDWAKVSLVDGSIIKCDVQASTLENSRSATVTVSVKDYPSAKATFRIEQEGIFSTYEMVFVDGGTFTMGATSEQGSDANDNESPTHSVTLSGFYIGKTEVTQKQWQNVMSSNPSSFKGDELPVENVSWNDCQTFINKLNQLTGKKFRLPTEAEWEYAARGGNKSKGYKYSGSNTIGNVAWYSGNSSSRTHPVATKQANELGLYDMSGNVWEWCQDWYGSYSSSSQANPTGPTSGSYRVGRGGSWRNGATYCRVSYRYSRNPTDLIYYMGFRLALSQ